MRSLARKLLPLGWSFAGMSGDGHVRLVHPEHGEVRLPASPSTQGFERYTLVKVAAAMDIPTAELKRRLLGAGYASSQPASQRKERRRRPKASRVPVVRHRGPAVSLDARIDRLSGQRTAARAAGDAAQAAALTVKLDRLYAEKRRAAA